MNYDSYIMGKILTQAGGLFEPKKITDKEDNPKEKPAREKNNSFQIEHIRQK